MFVHVFRAKLHRVVVTEANLNYMGSITVDENLLDASGIFPNEKVMTLDEAKKHTPTAVYVDESNHITSSH